MILTMLPDLEEVAQTADEIVLYCRLEGLGADTVRLCLVEALNNAVIHGQCPDQSITVEIEASAPSLSFRITDPHRQLTGGHLPTEANYLADLLQEASGRGLAIINELTDWICVDEGALCFGFKELR